MKLISRETDYAVRALCFIAGQAGRVVSVPELVEELKIPRPFLRKMLQVLNKKGVLKSYKGKGGGFELAKAPSEIYLMDVLQAFQGPFSLNECIFKKRVCPNKKTCPLRREIMAIEEEAAARLKPVTIASLLGQ